MLGTNGLFSSEYEGSLSHQEQAQRLFGQPDVLVVHEFLYVYQNRPALTAERRLIAAVLRDAIDCYLRFYNAKKGREKKIFAEVREWFFSGEEDGVFSFANVCEILKLDPGYIQRGLLGYKHLAEQRGRAQAKLLPESAAELRLAS